MQTDNDRHAQFNSLVEEIQDISPLSYFILYGCKVVWSDNAKMTASVGLPDKKRFVFTYGKEFWDKLNQIERLFLMLHECYHVFLEHFCRFETVTRIKNMAMDTALNHTLLRHFSFDRKKDMPYLSVHGCWSDTIVKGKVLVDSLSSEEYLLILEENMPDVDPNMDSMDEHGESDIPKDALDEILEGFDKDDKLTEEEKEEIKEEVEKIKSIAGETKLDTKPAIFNTKKKMPWSSYARRLVKSHYGSEMEESWLPDKRRVAVAGDLMMPTEYELENLEKIKIILFLDTSFSCDVYKKDFLGFGKAMPADLYEIICYGFDTRVYPIDLKAPSFGTGWGTSFAQIPKVFNSHKGRKYGFIFTDGETNAINWGGIEKQLTFFLYQKHIQQYSKNLPLKEGAKLEVLNRFE